MTIDEAAVIREIARNWHNHQRYTGRPEEPPLFASEHDRWQFARECIELLRQGGVRFAGSMYESWVWPPDKKEWTDEMRLWLREEYEWDGRKRDRANGLCNAVQQLLQSKDSMLDARIALVNFAKERAAALGVPLPSGMDWASTEFHKALFDEIKHTEGMAQRLKSQLEQRLIEIGALDQLFIAV